MYEPNPPNPSFNQPLHSPIKPAQVSQENGWGLAGMIVSIAGLILCGIPSIIGLILSIIGLRKEPKGFAIAGTIIGIVGILELVAFGLLMVSLYQLAASAGSMVRSLTTEAQLQQEASTIGDHWESNSRLPTQQEGDDLLKGKRDLMGNSLVYETDGSSFTLRSAGEDGVLQTDDDITVGPFSDLESVREIDPNLKFEEWNQEDWEADWGNPPENDD